RCASHASRLPNGAPPVGLTLGRVGEWLGGLFGGATASPATVTAGGSSGPVPRDLRVEPDLWYRLINLASLYPFEQVTAWRNQARNGQVRYWIAYGEEAESIGATTQ